MARRYVQSFGDVLEFESARTTATAPDAPDDVTDNATLQRFSRTLARIYERHKFVVETLAQVCLSSASCLCFQCLSQHLSDPQTPTTL